jgi:hypothetical protein
MRQFQNFSVLGYLVAAVCVFLGVTTLLAGQSSSRRGRESVSRADEPKKFWIGIAVLGIVALVGIFIGMSGGR